MMFANTFAVCGEHDQAIASYRTAMRLYPASHEPVLCLAQEMLALASHAEAQRFLASTRELCDTDPLVFNECGTLAYQQQRYDDARRHFEHAAALLTDKMQPSVVETVHNNLGHTLRCQQFVQEQTTSTKAHPF